MEFTEEQRNEATQELYKTIYYGKENTNLEDVIKCVENGAYLTGITSSYGIPLLYAMNEWCSPNIIKYLAEKGGVDWDYKVPFKVEYYAYYPDLKHIIDIDYISYNSIKNLLIDLKYSLENNPIIQNIIFKKYKNENPKFKYISQKPKKYLMNENINEKINKYIEYLKEYCNILNINYNDLHYRDYIICEPITYNYIMDENGFIPLDDNPYNWKPKYNNN
jgi:hypothetical protein